MKVHSSARTPIRTARNRLQRKCCESTKCDLLKKSKTSQMCDRLKTKHQNQKKAIFLTSSDQEYIWSGRRRREVVHSVADGDTNF